MRLTIDIDAEIGENAKDAYWAAMTQGKVVKWAHFVEEALAEYTKQMQDEINNGQAFKERPQRSTGERFAGGRPLS